jgi:hypothetical protein
MSERRRKLYAGRKQIVPRGFDAMTLWPLILIRPGMLGDAGLIEHELVHYREQAWITPLWVAHYLLSRRFRLAAEARAYRRQIDIGGITRAQAAGMLLKYRIGITYQQAFDALR